MSLLNTVYRCKKKTLGIIFFLASVSYWVLVEQQLKNQYDNQEIVNILSLKYGQVLTVEKFLSLTLEANQSAEQLQTCVLPHLELTGHQNQEAYKPCRMKFDFGRLVNNRWVLDRENLQDYDIDSIVCEYRNVTRIDDFKLNYSSRASLSDNQLIFSEVIEVYCYYKKRLVYENIHAQIVRRSDLKAELIKREDNEQYKPMNILLLSYDSLSRVSWFKRLQKTTQFILNEMNFTLLYGHSIMGDGTPACMIPLLTGHKEEELPSALKSDPNGQYVDQVYPFIWNELHPKGYVSFHQEDWPQVTTFTYRMRGMSNKTAHHYMRAYQLGLWNRVSNNYYAGRDDLCVGSVKRHKRALSLINEFIDTYKNSYPNWISIMHYIENSHDGNARSHLIDNDLNEFLQENFASSRFDDNTAIFLYSDHGSRFAVERQNWQGDLEERTPFFSIYLPPSFRTKHPDKYTHLQRNSQQLTTSFDIYATLRELGCLKSQPKSLRSLSLLGPIPANRTCEQIGISMHYCTCQLDWQKLAPSDEQAQSFAAYIVDYINGVLLFPAKDICQSLQLKKIIEVKKALTKDDKVYLKAKLQTSPNDALYEVIAERQENSKQRFQIQSRMISRINAYGTQSKCLESVPARRKLTQDLRKFCLCRKRLFLRPVKRL